MKYLSTTEISSLWGISRRRIATLCKEGRIKGASFIGGNWLIPENAEKPDDNRTQETLLKSGWSERVSNDPKHHPQVYDRPSSTVRKDWCKRPQEAHIADGNKYRRLSVEEIAAIQGFSKEWVDIEGITETEKIAVLGNAVAIPVSLALASTIKENIQFCNETLIEICAGIGGLSFGFDYLKPIAKIELWDVAAKILRTDKPWPSECVVQDYAQNFDYKAFAGKVGLLCGGPPCQPWSQAGHQKGHDDPRDVMGFTPKAIADCEPEVFLFENVPGLFTASQHKEYVEALIEQMKNPKPNLTYGLSVAVLNAADFGVPQIRKRVFILGIKGKSNTFAKSILDKVKEKATYHDPSKPKANSKPWVTLREAFINIPVIEPWYEFNANEETLNRLNLDSDMDSQEEKSMAQENQESLGTSFKIENANTTELNYHSPKIELFWPHKNEKLSFVGGLWRFDSSDGFNIRKSLLGKSILGSDSNNIKGYVVKGNEIDSLTALLPFASSQVQVIYFDAPRLSSLCENCSSLNVTSTWLSLIKESATISLRLLNKKGFFILHTDEETCHYGRQVLDEVFGYYHHVTTFAWQKKYAPQNDKTKNNPTDAFDYIIVYSKSDLDEIDKIGIMQTPDDIIDDGDWRGCYIAGHKGAKSGSEATKFHVSAPPYRWNILDSHLPSGKYWFDSITGVLWFESVDEIGDFWIKVSAKDKNGSVTTKQIDFTVKESTGFEDHYQLPTDIWWLNKVNSKIVSSKDYFQIVMPDTSLNAIKGEQFSIVFKAEGGQPYSMENSAPGTGRYWEFSYNTLVNAIATASASFGKNGNSLPSRKKYFDRADAKKIMAVTNWLPWTEFGKSEDASRHLNALISSGLCFGEAIKTAKPQKLLAHLITLLSKKDDDIILSLGDYNAVMASVALKLRKRIIHITGATLSNINQWENMGEKRLLAVLQNKDSADVEKDDPMPIEYSINPCSLDVFELSKSELVLNKKNYSIVLNLDDTESIEDFYLGLAGGNKYSLCNQNFKGEMIFVLKSDEILDDSYLSKLSLQYSENRIAIVAERVELSEESIIPLNVSILHAPFDLITR